MAEAAGSEDNLHADTIKNYGVLKKHLPPVVEDVMTDLLERQGLSWEEYSEIRTLPTESKRAEHLLELMINKQRLDVFHDVFRKYNPSTVERVLKGERAQNPNLDIDAMIQDIHSMMKRKIEDDKQRDTKNEERDKQNALRDSMNEERDKQIEVFESQIKIILENLKDTEGRVTCLNIKLKEKETQLLESNETRLHIIEEYDSLKEKFDKINVEYNKLIELQPQLRQRIMGLEERLKQNHKEKNELKEKELISKERIDFLEKETKELTALLHALQMSCDNKDTYIKMIEFQLEVVRSENSRLYGEIQNLRKSTIMPKQTDMNTRNLPPINRVERTRPTTITKLPNIRPTEKKYW